MKKGAKIVLIVLAVLIIGLCSAYYVLAKASTTAAQVIVESGSVSVNGNAIQGEQILRKGDIIATQEGEATIILYDSVIITLEPNSEITLEQLTKEHPRVSQKSGSTWTKFADVVGVKTVDIETPDTVATVRGTEFGVDTDESGTAVLVGEGVVDTTADGETKSVRELQKMIKRKGLPAAISEMTAEEKQRVLKKSERTLTKLKILRTKEVFKNKFLLARAKNMYDVDETKIRTWLTQIDDGELDDNMIVEKSPIKPEALYKVKKMNDKIKEQQQRIAFIRSKLA